MDVKFSRLGSPKHYEDACEVLHKLSKSKSLSSSQNYLILKVLLGMSFVFLSFFLLCSSPFIFSLHAFSLLCSRGVNTFSTILLSLLCSRGGNTFLLFCISFWSHLFSTKSRPFPSGVVSSSSNTILYLGISILKLSTHKMYSLWSEILATLSIYVIKNLHRGIPKPEKNHTGPFSIHKRK